MSKKRITLRGETTPNRRQLLHHPLFAWLGLRPVLGQHTAAEHAALRRWAAGRSRVVEIGVAEGASAIGLREVMAPHGTLWLIDPFHLSRHRRVNAMMRAARRAVESCQNGNVIWTDKFSFEAVKDWNGQIDFLFLDGDHSHEGIQRDWDDWHRFVAPGGVVVFHDARVFPGGWTQPDWGPVRLVDDLFRASGPLPWEIIQEVDSTVVVIKKRKT